MTIDQFQQLDVIKHLLDGKLKKLEEIDQNLPSLCHFQNIEHETEESDKVSARVVECQKKIRDALQKHNEKINGPMTLVLAPPHQMSNQEMPNYNPFSLSSATQVKAKLPKLTLPKFCRDLTYWMSFWDSFESAVHRNLSISKVNKFNYLNLSCSRSYSH